MKITKGAMVFDHIKDRMDIRDNYKIGKVLGSGAYGEVKECVHKRTQARRAVKIINKDLMSQNEQDRMLEEVQILKGLDHPNVLKIFEAYTDSKNFYIVTEILSGGELFDMIIRYPYFKERDAAKIMNQIFQAISYCHSNKIVHRDIKPENVLLESKQGTDSLIKIIDFGTSLMYDPEKQKKLKQTIGTPYYIAPEVLKQTYDSKCDIWSRGVIMFILLSGKPPFDGNDDDEILKNVNKGKPSYTDDIWKKVSAEGKDLLRKLLEYKPKNRISAAECLGHPWFKKFLQPTDISAESNEVNMNILNNMKCFTGKLKMQQAALSFISVHLISNQEQE